MVRDLVDYAHEVDSVAGTFVHEMLGDRNVPAPDDLRKAVKYLNDAVADNDLHGVAVYARVLHILTEL